MKIKILKSLAGSKFSFIAGQEVEVNDELAKDLIRAGLAEGCEGNAKGSKSNRRRTNKS